MRTYRLGQPEDWLKIPDISMLTFAFLSDAIQQATGTILYIYQDKTLLAATSVAEDLRGMLEVSGLVWTERTLLKVSRYYKPQDLRIMLEHKVLNMLEGANSDEQGVLTSELKFILIDRPGTEEQELEHVDQLIDEDIYKEKPIKTQSEEPIEALEEADVDDL